MEILLDTNFILTCVKQKIDFNSAANEIFDKKIEWLIPEEVIEELKKLSERKGEKTKDKESAKLSLELIKIIPHKTIKLNNQNVDKGIIDYLKNKDIILATLDKKLKERAGVKILSIRGKKDLEII